MNGPTTSRPARADPASSSLADAIAAARAGAVVHWPAAARLAPLVALLTRRLERALDVEGPLADALARLPWERFADALSAVGGELDASGEHLATFARLLALDGARSENLLRVPFDKSLRACIPGAGRKNYGYFVHRDSWFDLAPDGVNVVVYLSDVPAAANTQFFLELFGAEVAHEPRTRRMVDEARLPPAWSIPCARGDALIFSGEHVHRGAIEDAPRLSVEMRVSRGTAHGRPATGIVYSPLASFP